MMDDHCNPVNPVSGGLTKPVSGIACLGLMAFAALLAVQFLPRGCADVVEATRQTLQVCARANMSAQDCLARVEGK